MANGKAGAPKGNQNARQGFQARRACLKAVQRITWKMENPGKEPNQFVQEFEALVRMWEMAIEKAIDEKDLPALNAVMDRIDGKAAATVVHEGELITKEKVLTPEDAAAINKALEDAN